MTIYNDALNANEFKYKLIRENDNLCKFSEDAGFIVWEKGKYKKINEGLIGIELGTSCILGPFNMFYTWQTTQIEDIIEMQTSFVKFKTSNSIYTLYKI